MLVTSRKHQSHARDLAMRPFYFLPPHQCTGACLRYINMYFLPYMRPWRVVERHEQFRSLRVPIIRRKGAHIYPRSRYFTCGVDECCRLVAIMRGNLSMVESSLFLPEKRGSSLPLCYQTKGITFRGLACPRGRLVVIQVG